jgi:hypothetical protein
VVSFFKFFHQRICDSVPADHLIVFVDRLCKFVILEVEVIKQCTELQNFTILNLILEIFSVVFSIKTIYSNIGDGLDLVLETVTACVVRENFRDKDIIEYVVEVLTSHFKKTRKFSRCH